jgi:hypothetical protein
VERLLSSRSVRAPVRNYDGWPLACASRLDVRYAVLHLASLAVITWDLLSLAWYGDVGALCCDAWASPNFADPVQSYTVCYF